VVFCA